VKRAPCKLYYTQGSSYDLAIIDFPLQLHQEYYTLDCLQKLTPYIHECSKNMMT